jgi:hypothetical protein
LCLRLFFFLFSNTSLQMIENDIKIFLWVYADKHIRCCQFQRYTYWANGICSLFRFWDIRNLAELHSFRLGTGRIKTQGKFLVGWLYLLERSMMYWLCSAYQSSSVFSPATRHVNRDQPVSVLDAVGVGFARCFQLYMYYQSY